MRRLSDFKTIPHRVHIVQCIVLFALKFKQRNIFVISRFLRAKKLLNYFFMSMECSSMVSRDPCSNPNWFAVSSSKSKNLDHTNNASLFVKQDTTFLSRASISQMIQSRLRQSPNCRFPESPSGGRSGIHPSEVAGQPK